MNLLYDRTKLSKVDFSFIYLYIDMVVLGIGYHRDSSTLLTRWTDYAQFGQYDDT